MAIDVIKTNGNVMLVSPNSVNINTDMVNGVPQYENMYIFAELTAQSKGRTIIINSDAQTTTSKKVNFIGNDQNNNVDNPNYLNFTTNYYDGSTGENTHYEGFGINNIKIVINSSFIPQVSIQFVDVRGLAFFNQTESPYRILFDFPPPIFTLTVKGYYGKPITYRLHLVKYTSEFSSANGNFIIDAQFVAMTFAPLSDILFRYIVNTPLIDDAASMTPKPNVPPKNTYELILKLKNLYKEIAKKLETDEENIEYKDINDDVKKIDAINEILNGFKGNEGLNKPGIPLMVIRAPFVDDSRYIFPKTNSIPDEQLEIIEHTSAFDTIIASSQSSGRKSTPKHRLYILYLVGDGIPIPDNTKPPTTYTTPKPLYWQNPTQNDSGFNKALVAYKKMLQGEATTIVSLNSRDDDIADPKSFLNKSNVVNGTFDYSNTGGTKYYGLDITTFYHKIYQKKAELEKDRTQLAIDIITKINNMVQEKLGMIPSIYNIFDIILSDVDKFFNKLKSVSYEAYKSHNNIDANKRLILGDGGYAENKNLEVYSFPLIINKGLDGREERIAPVELRRKIPFPEIDLCTDFIDTFLAQRRLEKEYNLKDDQADDGTYKWIPISPFDSTIGGASPQSPYLGLSDDVRTETLKILLNRFYMLTQGTLPEAFYAEPTDDRKKDKANIIINDAYVELYGKAEAINLNSAIFSEKTRMAIEVMANQYNRTKLERFYEDIKKVSFTYATGNTGPPATSNIYSFPTNDPKYLLINPSFTSEGRVYTNKTNEGFEGIEFIDGTVEVQELNEKSKNLIDGFFENTENKRLFGGDPAEHFFEFTKQNLLYIRDKIGNKRVTDYISEIPLRTRFLSDATYYPATGQRDRNFPGSGNDDAERQEIAYQEGNNSFTYLGSNEGRLLDRSRDIAQVWSDVLGNYDTEIIDTITGETTDDRRISSILILSNFGYTVSPFNKYPNSLNSIVFDTPAAIEIPAYYTPYLGALLNAIENDWVDGSTGILEYFINGPGKNLPNRGFYILADLHDIELYLSEKDKQELRNTYNSYMKRFHDEIRSQIGELYISVHTNTGLNFNSPGYTPTLAQKKMDLYRYFLDDNANLGRVEKNIDPSGGKGQYFSTILKNLIIRKNLLNYSQLTFEMPQTGEVLFQNSGYTSLKELNTNGIGTLSSGATKTINDSYFTSLFTTLAKLVVEKRAEINDEKEEQDKSKGDSDIMNQLYYSFKNINDKWLTGTAVNNKKGFPFNPDGKRMIDLFSFVDRGMNPIGETILNAEILTEMMNDPNISLFTVLSQLLSLNGFEFFPLQNFLNFKDENSWKESFEIYNGPIGQDENTFFVCMYIGGSASYPSVEGNGFQNDGIIDITEPGVKGFEKNTSGSQYEENQNQEKNTNFPWREVRAFRVRFGEQNQSMFTDMKIDSKEYPETNESIQILSRLAGDNNPDAGIPKGQNLYNLYENRSYKATITGFGNAMIQPTQYFQLENIPMFNGAYIILTVEHNITANKMTTSFSGTKLLKYPMPRVLTPVAFMNYDGQSIGDYTRQALTLGTQLTSMEPDRVGNRKDKGGLDGVFGVDVSHHNGVADWKKAKADRVEFAFIKLTQGDSFYSGSVPNYDIDKQINDAIDNKVEVGYYHFAEWGNTSDPEVDGVTQANNFISRLSEVPKSKFPAVLDVEGGWAWAAKRGVPYRWSNKTTDLNIMIQSFINTMADVGYETMIYSRKGFMEEQQITGFGKQALWLPHWFDLRGKNNPERDEPPVPKDWFDWDVWQFSAQGIVDGIQPAQQEGAEGVDLNVMRKRFFRKYT